MARGTKSAKEQGQVACEGAVFAVFRSAERADDCYSELIGRGYMPTDINVVMSDDTRVRNFPHDKSKGSKAGSKAAEGMGVGGAIGTAVGATLAAVAAIGTSVAFPGLGLVVAGPIAAALAGGGAGAAAGGLVGGLIGLGFTEQNAQTYNEAIASGGVIMSVQTDNSEEADNVSKLFMEYGGEEIAIC